MKTKTIKIDTIPQVILGITEIRGLLGSALQERMDGCEGDCYLERAVLSAILNGKYTYSIEKMDEHDRKKTVIKFRKDDRNCIEYSAEFFPRGDNDDQMGCNVYRKYDFDWKLSFSFNWTMEDLYDLDVIEFD